MSDTTDTSFFYRLISWFSTTETKSLEQAQTQPDKIDHGANWIRPQGVKATYSQEEAMTAYAGHGYTYAAVSRSSQDLAALPLRLLKGKEGTLIEDHPVIDLMNDPSSNMDGYLLREQICTDLILTGNCYLLMIGTSEEPSSIVRLHPASVKVQTDTTGVSGYIYDSGGQRVLYNKDRVIHGRLASWTSSAAQVLGTGSIESLSREIRADINSQNLVSDASAKARPDVLIYPKDPSDIWGPQMRQEIAGEYRKLSQSGGAMILSGLAEIEPLTLSAREMEYTEARRMARQSISAVIGTPPSILGLPSANYATSRQEARNYWTVQIKRGKRLALLYTKIAKLFDPELYFEHDYSGVEALQEVRTEQLNRVQLHILNGVSPRAAYKYEGLEYPEEIEGNEEAADQTDETAEDVRSLLLKMYTKGNTDAITEIVKAYTKENEETELEPEEEAELEHDTEIKQDPLSTFENRREAFESLSDTIKDTLTKKAKEHREEVGDDPKKQTDKTILAVCFLRGIGAYESNPESVRPTVGSSTQWGLARVNGLLYALRNQRFRRKPYDTDLLPKDHPLSTRGEDEERRHLLFGYETLDKAPKEESWGFTEREARQLLGDPPNFDQYSNSFLFVYKGREDDRKGYRLPIAKMIDGEPKLVFRGVIAAGSALRKEPKFNQGYYNLNRISDRDRKRMYGIVQNLYEMFGEEAPPYPEKKSTDLTIKAVGDKEPTNFPSDGDNEEVNLKNSQYQLFDPLYVLDIKENYPDIWRAGGNIEGSNQFRRLLPISRRQSQAPQTPTEEMAIRKREAWSARHLQDGAQFDSEDPPNPSISTIAGIVAQMKWLTVGALGEARMKQIVDEVKASTRKEKARRDLWRIYIRNIADPAEKELKRAAEGYLRGAVSRYKSRIKKYVEPTDQSIKKGVIDWASVLAKNEELTILKTALGAKWRKWFFASGNFQMNDILNAAGRDTGSNSFAPDDQFIEEQINLFARRVSSTNATAVQKVIEQGLIEGLAIDSIASNLSVAFAFSTAKATMIARTEATRAANMAAQKAYSQAQADGIRVRKQWLSSRDSKVRDNEYANHRWLDGQIVDANEYFVNELGFQALSPGDFGIPSEDINCRCTIIPIVDD